MKRVLITKNDVVTHKADFSTVELANAWLAQEEANLSFGKPERWVSEDRIQLEGEDIEQAAQMMIETIMGVDVKLYRFVAEYSKETTDVSAEYAAVAAKAERAAKRAFGLEVADAIAAVNESDDISVEQVVAFMSSPVVQALSALLNVGAIETFKVSLEAADVSAFFSSDQKAAIVAMCDAFLQSLGD